MASSSVTTSAHAGLDRGSVAQQRWIKVASRMGQLQRPQADPATVSSASLGAGSGDDDKEDSVGGGGGGIGFLALSTATW